MKDDRKRTLRARLSRNLTWTFAAQLAVSLIAVATLFITARALGPAGLGILALVEAYVRLVDLFLRLEPSQAVIRYGVRMQEEDNHAAFARLIKLSIVIDAVGSLLAGMVCMLLAALATRLIGLPADEGPHYVYLVAAGLFFSFRPTGTTVLRLFDRFDLLARVDVAAAVIRLALSLVAWQAGLGIWAFLVILLVQSLLDGLLAFVLAMRLLRNKRVRGVARGDLRLALAENPGFLRFLWNSNFNVILRQSVNRLDVLAVGALLNLQAVGFYQLGKKVMIRANKMAGPIRQVVFPELSRLWAKGQSIRFHLLVGRTSLAILSVQLLIALPILWYMETVIDILFGSNYAGAGAVMSILLVSSIVFASGVILNPALLAMGKDRLLVRVTTVSTVIFALSFLPLVRLYDVEGAAIANLIFNLAWTAGCLLGFQGVRRVQVG